MADYLVTDTDLTNIANAIRTKGGTSAQLTFPLGFVDAVSAIPTGGITPTGTKQITLTDNGTTTEDVTNYASAQITVAIPVYNGEIVTPAYNVTVTLTNPVNSGFFHTAYVTAWPGPGTFEDETELGRFQSPVGTISVSVDGVYGIAFYVDGLSPYVDESMFTCSGGVSYVNYTGHGGYGFQVTGDGTIVIDGIDYYD